MKINQKTQGIMYIVGAAFFFALMNLFVRLAGDVPTFQKCFFRNIVAAFVAIIMLHKNHVKFQIGKGNLKYLLYEERCHKTSHPLITQDYKARIL